MSEQDEVAEERRKEDRSDHWHVGREIPVAIILALVIQTAGGVWWLAQLSFKIDLAVAQLQEFKNERYTREDARRDRELISSQFEVIRQRDFDHERRIESLEIAAGRPPPRPNGR